jgi:long-chain fatty acid transport protein
LLTAAAVAAMLARARSVDASGFASARFGGEHGNVTTHNATALYYNPAGIGFSNGVHGFVDGTLALRHVSWEHDPSPLDPPDPAGGEGANSGRASLLNVFGAPMLGASVRLGDWAFGAALYVPFGGRAHWSQNEAFVDHRLFPDAGDGVQRWHTIQGALTYVYATAGAAYRIGPLSLGATGNLIFSSVFSRRARIFNPPEYAGLPVTDSEGRAEIEVSGIHGSFGLGAMLEALPGSLWLAASYQAQPALGPMRLNGKLTFTDVDGVQGAFDVTLDQALPDIFRLGARYRVSPTWELRVFGDLTRWSMLQTQCVALKGYPCVVTSTGAYVGDGGVWLNLRRYWRDTVGVRLGASHWIAPELELFAGAGFETAATPTDTLDPELPDAKTLSGALGARWEPWSKSFFAFSYTHIQSFDRDNTGKSRLPLADPPTRRPDGGGRYSQWIGVFNANFEKEF